MITKKFMPEKRANELHALPEGFVGKIIGFSGLGLDYDKVRYKFTLGRSFQEISSFNLNSNILGALVLQCLTFFKCVEN